MEDMALKCPLCCEKTFESKAELTEHLATLLDSIACPLCSIKFPTVALLIEHLSLDNCCVQNTVLPIYYDTNTEPDNRQIEVVNIKQNLEDNQKVEIKNGSENDVSDSLTTTNENTDDGSHMDRMYVEFLSKQLSKSCLQTQELKLVKDDGGISRYVFVMNENDEHEIDGESAVVTKQNNDGTISLTTVRDMKVESEQMVNQPSPEVEESQEEIYSCNTCGVSFTSVLEHIQNYHNDQDVVVEEPIEEMDTEICKNIEFEEQSDNVAVEAPTDKHVPRRMITETGDIIEEPVFLKNHSLTLDATENGGLRITDVWSEKKMRTSSRKHVVVDSVVKEINQPDEKSGPYHKVVIKVMEKQNGEKIKIFNCMSCKIYVSSLDEFKSHPCKKLKYTCVHCSVSYENAKSLCAHMKVHKTKGPEVPADEARTVYTCEICNTVFTNNKSLKLHKRMHDPIKSRPIEPPVESADGSEVSTDKFLCSICDKLIPIDYRTVHQNSHKGKTDFNCDVCNKQFQSENYLEMHMNVHLNEKIPAGRQDKSLPYMCLYCDRRFSRPHEKVKHERIHTGEKPHSCEICGKSFRVSYCLTLHMRTHTGARPYCCKHCGKRFKAHSVYNHHLLTHSEVRAYKCPYCPKAFKTSVQLAGHKNSHTKPFSCQHCNRPFASLYAVRVHTETHSKQNSLKFSCSMCGAKYARAFALKDHIKAIHKDASQADIDKAIDKMLVQQKEGDQITILRNKEEAWGMQTNADETPTEITIDAKNLTQEDDINKVTIMNYNISNELIVP